MMQTLGLTSEANSIYVHVTDNCPCLQFDGGSDTITGVNPPCCGNVNHFDLSYWGFQKIAHPAWGIMNIQFRYVVLEPRKPFVGSPFARSCTDLLRQRHCSTAVRGCIGSHYAWHDMWFIVAILQPQAGKHCLPHTYIASCLVASQALGWACN